MTKREEATVVLYSAIIATDHEFRVARTREAVGLLIDAAKEELRAEMASTVLGPSEKDVVEGGSEE